MNNSRSQGSTREGLGLGGLGAAALSGGKVPREPERCDSVSMSSDWAGGDGKLPPAPTLAALGMTPLTRCAVHLRACDAQHICRDCGAAGDQRCVMNCPYGDEP